MDICREAPAVCSTFYLYYDSVDMLKDDIENAEMYEIVRHTDAVVDVPLEVDMMSFLRDTIAYIRTKQAFYYAFLVHEPNADFIAKWKNAIKEHIRKRLRVLGLRPKTPNCVSRSSPPRQSVSMPSSSRIRTRSTRRILPRSPCTRCG